MACLKHEVPALIATAVINEGSFAELLDRRLKKMEALEANGTKTIEPPPEPIEVKPPTPSINHRAIKLKRRI